MIPSSNSMVTCDRITLMSEKIWILASNSPRRHELLALFRHPFLVQPADVDETLQPGEAPSDYVLRLAKTKARAVSEKRPESELIIAADTTVADGAEILGKPADAAEAESMLRQLRGRTHQVYTAIALMQPASKRLVTDICVSQVPMRQYTDEELASYIASGDPLDKAGAYGIQHAAFHPVESFSGCFASVMGFPMCHLTRQLIHLGINPKMDISQACQMHLQYTCPIFDAVLAGEDLG